MKKVLLSGVKPTGRPHIGNYFGAMKQMVDLQNTHPDAEKFFMIADYHGLNFIQNGEEMRQNILDLALDYLAIGLDPQKASIFKQSDVSAHTELAWIFDTITTMPYLMRAHAFKAAIEKYTDSTPAQRSLSSKLEQLPEIGVGTFNYPMLMAADILLYDATHVPVGQDQKQHIEYARDTAEKFNRIFGEAFVLPESLILKDVAVVPGTDGQKMSKSYGNTIPLFATDEEIKKSVMSIVTDSSAGMPKNVYEIHKLFRPQAELDALYSEKAGKYKDLKEALIADISAFIKPLREKREQLAKNKEAVLAVLKAGGEKARAKAGAKMEVVREKIGVKLY